MYKRLLQANKAGTMDLQIFFDALAEIGHQSFSQDSTSFDRVVEAVMAEAESLRSKGKTDVKEFSLSGGGKGK